MEKSLFEQMGGTYHQEADYFLPDLSVPELPAIGVWGQRRRQYLKNHCQALYTALLLSGKLNNHLSEVDEQAESMFSQLVKQMAEQEGKQSKREQGFKGVPFDGNEKCFALFLVQRLDFFFDYTGQDTSIGGVKPQIAYCYGLL